MEPSIEILVKNEASEVLFKAVTHNVERAVEELGRYERNADELKLREGFEDTII